MTINERLKSLYYSKLADLQTLVKNIGDVDTADYEGPLLMHCWEENYSKSKVNLMFLGQETNGWNGFLRPNSRENIDKTIKTYIDFELGRYEEF